MNMDRKMEVERKVPVRKALLVTHVSGFLPQFEMNNVRILQEMGYDEWYSEWKGERQCLMIWRS